MSSYNVSTRYAKALNSLADDKGNFVKIAADVELVLNTYTGSHELRVMLASPVVQESKKRDIIEALFGGEIEKESLEFLIFLLEKKRIIDLPYILKRFLELRDEKYGIVRVKIKSAVELDKSQGEKLESNFKSITDKDVELSYEIDKELIGGFVAQYGDTLIDASVKNQLRLLKKKLLHDN